MCQWSCGRYHLSLAILFDLSVSAPGSFWVCLVVSGHKMSERLRQGTLQFFRLKEKGVGRNVSGH